MPSICHRCGSEDGKECGRGGMFGVLCDPCLEVVGIVQIGALFMPGETFCKNCRRVATKYEQRGAVLGWFPRACGGRRGCVDLRNKPTTEHDFGDERQETIDRLRSMMKA